MFSQIFDISRSLYIGVQRRNYHNNNQSVEKQSEKKIFFQFTALKNLGSHLSPTLMQQVDHLEQEGKKLALKQEESATAQSPKWKKTNRYPIYGIVSNHLTLSTR